ncbi:MAG: hypothetical protein IKQ28_01615, partial [Lachnospiraceae bacterium]|nr:hypothetical protein [Lachnospiraceae bacterium]
AYRNEDYQACYQNLFGKELNESETIMFNSSECILRIRLWLREYEMLAEEGNEIRALDSLIQSVNAYPGLFSSASQWQCVDKVDPTYQEILGILTSKYGLTEEEARLIASEPDDVVYTKIVHYIVDGMTYSDAMAKATGAVPEGTSQPEEPVAIPKPDLLPEEDGMGSGNFVESGSGE